MFCLDHGPFIQMLRSWQIIYLTLNKRSSRMRACYISSVFKGLPVFFGKKMYFVRVEQNQKCLFMMDVCDMKVTFCPQAVVFFLFSWIFSKCVFCFIWMCFFCSLRLRKVMLTVAFTFFTKLISLMLWKTALFLGSVHIHYRDGELIKYLFKF